MPVEQFMTGNGTNSARARRRAARRSSSPTTPCGHARAIRKIALAELGRSGAVLTGRVDEDGRSVFGITAATWRPTVLRYDGLPDAATLRSDAASADGYYTDPLGTADWRREVSGVLARGDRRQELAA